MNIISCDNCGVLLDADRLSFPTDLYKEENGYIQADETKAVWGKEGGFVPFVPCPVCGSKVVQPC